MKKMKSFFEVRLEAENGESMFVSPQEVSQLCDTNGFTEPDEPMLTIVRPAAVDSWHEVSYLRTASGPLRARWRRMCSSGCFLEGAVTLREYEWKGGQWVETRREYA